MKTKTQNGERPMIIKIQNQEYPLLCLHVQKSLYRKVKKFSCKKMVILLLLILLSASSTYFHNSEILAYINAFAVVLTLIRIHINVKALELKQKAAKIQGYFDFFLFSRTLPRDNFDIRNVISEFECSEIVSKYTKPNSKISEDLKDWYNNREIFPPIVQVYLCQYQNIEWDYELRNKFKTICTFTIMITIVLPAFFCLYNNSSFVNWFSAVVLILPLFQYLYSMNIDLKSDIQINNKIRSLAKEIGNEISNDIGTDSRNNDYSITKKMMDLQEQINYAREKKVLIPDFIYKLNKKTQQNKVDSFIKVLESKYTAGS